MDRLNRPIPVIYRDEDWFIVNKPYDCRIQDYPNTTDTSGKLLPPPLFDFLFYLYPFS